MRRFIDLHTHSTASDGTLTPSELVARADDARLAAVALTDHDTVAGLGEARAAAEARGELRFIPGIELSARPPSGTLHILGLGIDETAASILAVAEYLREARRRRNPRIVDQLRRLGIPLTMEDVRVAAEGDGSGEVLGRAHVARALVRGGHVRNTGEAFRRYIGKGKPAYVERERPEAREVIRAIHEAGGLAILAHPVHLACTDRAHLTRVVASLAEEGIDGLEAWHSDHSPEWTRACMDLAAEMGLGLTGGSDFHGQAKPGVRLGRPAVTCGALTEPIRTRLLGRRS